jgi:Fe-S-cluster containining protein
MIPMSKAGALGSMFERSSPKQRQVITAMWKHYVSELQTVSAQAINPESIAYSVHELIDQHVAKLLATDRAAPRVACKRGCASCCHIHVWIDPHEARLLATVIAHEGIEVDRARLARQAGHTLESWRSLPAVDRRCVLLDEADECRVYEHRPTACRKYLVVDTPKWCDTVSHPGAQVGILASPEAETIAVAALKAFPGAAPLPDMLLGALPP